MDQVAKEVEKVKKDFQETFDQTLKHIDSIQEYGKSSRIEEAEKKDSLPRLNGLAQDGLNMLQSLHFNLDLLAPQLPSADDVNKAQSLAQLWKNQIQRTKAGMTSAAESITEPSAQSPTHGSEESTGVLKKAESEYKGHRSLFSRTRGLLSTMQRQDVLDRVIIIAGFVVFSLAVLYVVSKRIGILKLQRQVIAAVKAGMAGKEEIAPIIGGRDGMNVVPVHQNMVPNLNVPLEQPMKHDEL